jgi:general secretion pathway protein L
VYLNQAEYEAHTEALDVLRARLPSVQTKLLPEGPLPLFALQAVQSIAVNLLSGQYARKKSWNKTLAPWRMAAILTGVMVLLHLSVSGLQMLQLTRSEKQLDQQIRELVSQTLPGTQVSDTRKARQLFEVPLKAASAGGGEAGLLSSLEVLKSTFEQMTDTRVDALAYRPKVIDLRVTAPNVDALARIQQLINEQGLHAEIQSATPRDNKVEARLQLKSPGA